MIRPVLALAMLAGIASAALAEEAAVTRRSVADLKAVGDTTVPGVAGTSAYSADSNAFFARARTPAAPGLVVVVQ